MNICPTHNVVMAELGRMTLDGPIEYGCEFCMNDIGPYPECIHEPEGDCSGKVGVMRSDYGTIMVMCWSHQSRYYERQDQIAAISQSGRTNHEHRISGE